MLRNDSQFGWSCDWWDGVCRAEGYSVPRNLEPAVPLSLTEAEGRELDHKVRCLHDSPLLTLTFSQDSLELTFDDLLFQTALHEAGVDQSSDSGSLAWPITLRLQGISAWRLGQVALAARVVGSLRTLKHSLRGALRRLHEVQAGRAYHLPEGDWLIILKFRPNPLRQLLDWDPTARSGLGFEQEFLLAVHCQAVEWTTDHEALWEKRHGGLLREVYQEAAGRKKALYGF